MVPVDMELHWVNVKQKHSDRFRHIQAYPGIIQAYLGIFKALCNPSIFRIEVYPEPWHVQNQKHIQNPGICIHNPSIFRTPYIQNDGIFKIRGIFRTLSNIYDEVLQN